LTALNIHKNEKNQFLKALPGDVNLIFEGRFSRSIPRIGKK